MNECCVLYSFTILFFLTEFLRQDIAPGVNKVIVVVITRGVNKVTHIWNFLKIEEKQNERKKYLFFY